MGVWTPGPGATEGNDRFVGDGSAESVNGLAGNDDLRGNDGDDTLQGGEGDDSLSGESGHDRVEGGNGDDQIYGGEGDDTLIGGAGNDSLREDYQAHTFSSVIDAGDGDDSISFLQIHGGPMTATVTGGTGNDILYAADITAMTISGVETLWEAGSGEVRLLPEQISLFQVITTNVLRLANDGDVDLRGRWQASIPSALSIYAHDFGNTFWLPEHTGAIHVSGSFGADIVYGGGAEDNLQGRGGADTLHGGAGNDSSDGGAGSDHLTGGDGNDRLNSGYSDTAQDRNHLDGGAGDDTLSTAFSDAFGDTLIGGSGNDLYYIRFSGSDPRAAFQIVELAGGGIDTLSVNGVNLNFELSGSLAEVENVQIDGAGARVVGNGYDNMLVGGFQSDTLIGGSGNDTLGSGVGITNSGADSLIGGAGDDVYYYADLALTGGGSGNPYVDEPDTIVELPGEGIDTVEATGDIVLPDNVEHAILMEHPANLSFGTFSATGNAEHNRLTGNLQSNTLTGLGGNDTLNGGGTAPDTLVGGTGDDVYINPTLDTIVELAGEGHDRVESDRTFSLAAIAHVEDLTLTGAGNFNATGNALGNALTGNSGANRLEGGGGGDILDGGAGVDTLAGGLGDDSYVNPHGDVIAEAAGEGIDTVESGATFSLAAIAHVENVTLNGGGDIDAAGNALDNYLKGNSGANVLTGGAGADTLEGGAGIDRLIGGTGNDTYLNPAYGEIVEVAGQGFDRVISDVSFSLVSLSGIERLELTGNVPGFLRGNGNANSLIGNAGSNTMHGYDGNDTILGLGGRDTIAGGLGRDTIAPGLERDTVQWDSVPESTGPGRDMISEFVFSVGGSAYERLDFHVTPNAVRATITTGILNEASFNSDLQAAVNASNLGAGQAVLFDPSGGDLNVAGHLYLIVDVNGQAGYQQGADYVVQFTSTYGVLTLANFI